MTQAAVSYQLKLLEDRLGVPLFRREKKRVILTDSGARAAATVSRAFDGLDAAFAGLRAENEAMLTISTTETFANTWLAWNLGAFQLRNPDMAVRLNVDHALTDFARDEVDVAIRSGRGPFSDVHADRLFTVTFTPMCSPGFLERHGGALEPKDLLHLPQISPHDSWWTHWLREAGVEVPDGPPRAGIRLDSQAQEGAAAMAGQGVAMLTTFLWRHDIAEGRLVHPFTQVSSRGYGYWLVFPEHRRNVAKIKRFRDWLLDTLGDAVARHEAGTEVVARR